MTGPYTARSAHRSKAHGFTMVELVITVVVLAVLLAIAVPSMRELIARQRVASIAKELATDLRYLRTKAIEGKDSVTIKFGSNDASTCYVLFAYGADELECNCARTDGQSSCGNGAGHGEDLKTVLIPRTRGVTLAATPTSLELTGFNGLPRIVPDENTLQTIQASS